jgi:outer membrane protein
VLIVSVGSIRRLSGLRAPVVGRASLALLALLVAPRAGATDVPSAAPVSAASAPPLALAQVLEGALDRNPGVAAKRKLVEIADAEELATAAHLLPVLRTEANAMLWNSDNRYAFDTSGFQALFAQMGAPPSLRVPPMEVQVRDQVMAKVTVMAIQPLTQLWQIARGREARKHMARASRSDAVTAERDLELEAARAFFGHVSAQEMLTTLAEAERTVAAYEKLTSDYVRGGLVERDALLKVQLQREELAKSKAAVEKGVALTRAQLNMLMGRPLDTPLTVAHEAVGGASSASAPVEDLQREALERRPELASGRAQRAAAESAFEATRAKLLPDLNLVGAYNHNAGMGDLMLRNEAFVGLMLGWNAFEWGATAHEVRAAELRKEQAELMVRAAERGLALHVHQKALELAEAGKQRAVAEAGLALAKESLRLEENRYAVHETEAAELIRAQVAAVKAAHDVTLATMQIELARRELAIATGHDLLESTDAPVKEMTK